MSAESPSQSHTSDAGAAARQPAGNLAGRVPDFFIIGHEKCGTTALYKLLAGHPQIYMPELKEPRFFVADPAGRKPADGEGLGVRPRTLDEYLALFAPAAAG